MNCSRFGHNSLRSVRLALIAGSLVVALATATGCNSVASFVSGWFDSQDSAGSPVSTSSNPASTSSPSTPTATATVQPTATPDPEPNVTQEQAESTVRAWFEALGSEDYQGAESITSGDARSYTRQLAETVQREADEQGVTADIVVQRLELSPSQAQTAAGRAVRANFDIAVNAIAGPFSVQARRFEGEATFIVEQVDGDAKITNIRDVTGLPLP